ncbi:ABC transporter substrate-binding protein [Cohnella algarum]|uniref:ABC transporter substrate-binding protein n=1 Tax=Cohnella algarum TaxID=2044859 RepID=UPI001966FFBB|nr:extracellular solute-binding protein [Cohnella algarum]MBN2983416.1 extracellular solute-binding protein [Cohnella algarum]
MRSFLRLHTLKSLSVVLVLSVVAALAAACSGGDASDDPNNRRTLRIGMVSGSQDSESYYRQEYTDMFELSKGNIDIEFQYATDYSEMMYASEEEQKEFQQIDTYERLKEMLTGPNPVDVLVTDQGTMGRLIQDNLLVSLDSYIKKDKVDLEAFVPSVIESIREAGNNQVYGLTSTFSSSVLFYNKTLFSKAGVTPPTDGMTWDQIFDLATQMSTGEGAERIFGLTLNDWNSELSMYSVNNIVAPLKLRMFDDKAETMTVNTPQWERAWERPIELAQQKVIPSAEDFVEEMPADGNYRYNPYSNRPFFTNRVAMMISNNYLINELKTYNDNVDKMENYEPLDWDVVTYPVLPEMPEASSGMYLGEVMVINANAANADDAWEFIKFSTSKETAKFKARSTYQMSSLTEFVKPLDGMAYNIEAFYKQKPIPYEYNQAEQSLYRERPNLGYIQQLGDQSFQKAVRGDLGVKEALQEWQENGNELLQEIKQNPTGEIDLTPYLGDQEAIQREMLRRASGG